MQYHAKEPRKNSVKQIYSIDQDNQLFLPPVKLIKY